MQLQGNTTDNKLNVTGKQNSAAETTTVNGILTAVDIAKGTITVQLTGRQVKVDISNAQIQNFAGTTTLKIAGLKLLTGREIRLDGLSKNGNVLSASQVQVRIIQHNGHPDCGEFPVLVWKIFFKWFIETCNKNQSFHVVCCIEQKTGGRNAK